MLLLRNAYDAECYCHYFGFFWCGKLLMKASVQSYCWKLLRGTTAANTATRWYCFGMLLQNSTAANATAECNSWGILLQYATTGECYCWRYCWRYCFGCGILLLWYAITLLQLLLSNDIAQYESMADYVVECYCSSLRVVVINPLFNLFIIATTDD